MDRVGLARPAVVRGDPPAGLGDQQPTGGDVPDATQDVYISHGGAITLQSTVGEGTRAIVRLPLLSTSPTPSRPAVASGSASRRVTVPGG